MDMWVRLLIIVLFITLLKDFKFWSQEVGVVLNWFLLPLRSKKQGDLRNSLFSLGVTRLWQVAQWVVRAPPHHALPAFLNLNGIKLRALMCSLRTLLRMNSNHHFDSTRNFYNNICFKLKCNKSQFYKLSCLGLYAPATWGWRTQGGAQG